MWWKGQNLDKPIIAKDGTEWHFLVWQNLVHGVHQEKIFFWDIDKKTTGIVELPESVHINKLKDRMKKIANDKMYRDKYICDLQFPIEKHY